MPIFKDVKTAARIVRNAVRSREQRRELVRRSPMLPKWTPGSIQVVVHFADSKVNLYQLRQWYAPLAELAKTTPVAIIARSPGTALTL